MTATLRTASHNWQQRSQQAYALVIARDELASGISLDEHNPDGRSQLDRVYKKLTLRLMPVFMLMLGLNYLDRTSLAFASIQMTQDLQFSPEVYGMASGLFFLTYCMMQVPANFVCMALGVQRWFSGMLLVWGLTAAAFAAVKTPWQFYVLRLVLGVAEAGSFPGVWYAISLWFPPDRIAFPYSLVGAAVAISQVLAAPIAAALLKLDGVWGLAGWQWVFLGEGLPSIALALCLPWLLPDGPHRMVQQGFGGLLEPHELELLQSDYASKFAQNDRHSDADCSTENAAKLRYPAQYSTAAGTAAGLSGGTSPLKLLLSVAKVWQVWYLAVCNIFKDIANLALMMWLPVMVHSMLSGGDPTQMVARQHSGSSSNGTSSSSGASQEGKSSTAETGTLAVLLSAIPFTAAAAAVAASGVLAQKTGRPLLFIIIPNLVGGISFLCFHWVVPLSRSAGFICLVITLSCAYAASPHAPTIIARLTHGPSAAIAMPCYNSVAMLGGFAGPAIMGFFVQHFGGFKVATSLMGGSMILSGFMAWILMCIMKNHATKTVTVGEDVCQQSATSITYSARHATAAAAAAAVAAADGYDIVYRSSSQTRQCISQHPESQLFQDVPADAATRIGSDHMILQTSSDHGSIVREQKGLTCASALVGSIVDRSVGVCDGLVHRSSSYTKHGAVATADALTNSIGSASGPIVCRSTSKIMHGYMAMGKGSGSGPARPVSEQELVQLLGHREAS